MLKTLNINLFQVSPSQVQTDDGAGTDVGDGERYVASTGVEEIELFTGGAVAFDAEFLAATHGFDRRWFLYYEDIDLGRRGAALGWRYLLVRESVVDAQERFM